MEGQLRNTIVAVLTDHFAEYTGHLAENERVTLVNAEYMQPLYHSSTGRKLNLLGLAMMAVGSAILKKIVSFRG